MKIRPLHDRVIVKRVEAEKYAPPVRHRHPRHRRREARPGRGQVAVGSGKILDDGKVRPMALKAGDRVLFGKYSGQAVKVEGEELLVMREEDIMGVVEA
jgi:chaperonin GroES